MKNVPKMSEAATSGPAVKSEEITYYSLEIAHDTRGKAIYSLIAVMETME